MIFKFLIILGIIPIPLTYILNRYTKLDYPNTFEEKLILFVSGAIGMGFTAIVLFYDITTTKELLGLLIFAGIFGGILFSFAVPHRMKTLNREKNHKR